MMGTDLYQDFFDASASPTLNRPKAAGDDVEIRLARARGKARSEGFADGAASAEATFDRELLSRINSVSEALVHFAADREASDAASIHSLRRIVAGALAAFMPSVANATLPGLVADTVAKALAAELAGAVVVETTAERMPNLQEALNGRDARLSFREDPCLTPGAARVVWRGGFDHIDARAAIEAGAALLDERLRAATAQKANKEDNS